MQNSLNPINQITGSPLLKPSYGFVKTDNIIEKFEAKGWQLKNTYVSKVKKIEKQGYQKHMLKFEHPEFDHIPGLEKRNQTRPQLCLLNSHDGSTSFRVYIGMLRMACLNGLIVGTAISNFKLIHSKNITSKLPLVIDQVVDQFPLAFDAVKKLATLQFSPAARDEFIKLVVDERLKNVKRIISVDYESSLRVIRQADIGKDAYTTMNLVQEKLLRGGIRYTYERNCKDYRGVEYSTNTTTITKAIRSLDAQLRLNQLVFDKALELAS